MRSYFEINDQTKWNLKAAFKIYYKEYKSFGPAVARMKEDLTSITKLPNILQSTVKKAGSYMERWEKHKKEFQGILKEEKAQEEQEKSNPPSEPTSQANYHQLNISNIENIESFQNINGNLIQGRDDFSGKALNDPHNEDREAVAADKIDRTDKENKDYSTSTDDTDEEDNIIDNNEIEDDSAADDDEVGDTSSLENMTSFRKCIYKYYHALENKKDVGSLPTVALQYLSISSSHRPLDVYTLEILNKWEKEGSISANEQQFLRLSMSRILDTINKRNPVLGLVGPNKIKEYEDTIPNKAMEVPTTISTFINHFNKQITDKNEDELMVFIITEKLTAWKEGNRDLVEVIEIYEYLALNLSHIKQVDKTYSELQCFFPVYNILNILFRNTEIRLVIGEKGCDASKNARIINEQCTSLKKPANIYGRKLDLMLMYKNVVLCSAEWKSIASSKATVLKQFVKNLRVNQCILHELHQHLEDNNANILGMDWKGFFGYMYTMTKIEGISFVKEKCRLFLPQERHEFEEFIETIQSLLEFKSHYIKIVNELKPKLSKRKREEFFEEHFDVTPTNSRSPSPQTFFSPKKPKTTSHREE